MKSLYLLENITEETISNLNYASNSHIVAFDYKSHKLLVKHNIDHQTIDDFLDDKERMVIFQFCFSLWDWYDKIDESDLKFHNVNLLSIIDRNELHEALMNVVPRIHAAKKAIEKTKPEFIFASENMYELLASYNNKIEKIQESNANSDDYFTLDRINVSYEIFGFNFGIKLSRKKYELIKRNLEKIITNIFGLRKKISNKKKIVLVEFNPEVFYNLLEEINRRGLQPVLINFRRSAMWSKNAIIQLKKSHSHVAIPEDWISKESLLQIKTTRNTYLKRIHDMFQTDEILSKIFVFDGIRFDQRMKNIFLKVLEDRLDEYLLEIYFAESVSKSNDIIAILMLNLSGETEKVFSSYQSKNMPILLQHSFSNYTPSISHLDALDDFHLIKNKIMVWGEEVKKYIIENRAVHEDKIIVSGSPKYDSFVATKKNNENKKTILVTPRPIIHHVEGLRIELYEKYEKTIDKLLELTKIDNIEVIFKLHPQQIGHNEIIKQYIKNKNPNIKILQYRSIRDLLTQCDLHVNIAPDNFDASSVILEAMILERPTLNIQLQSTKIEFEFMKHGAVKTINFESDIMEQVKQLLDKETSYELIKNSQKYLKQYISNHGNASTTLVDIIKNSR